MGPFPLTFEFVDIFKFGRYKNVAKTSHSKSNYDFNGFIEKHENRIDFELMKKSIAGKLNVESIHQTEQNAHIQSIQIP